MTNESSRPTETEAYTKIEIAVDNMSDKFRERKIMKQISQVLDSIDRIAGEDGKPILPMFISENVSKVYFRDNPPIENGTHYQFKNKWTWNRGWLYVHSTYRGFFSGI
jgi:hypothetical protein